MLYIYNVSNTKYRLTSIGLQVHVSTYCHFDVVILYLEPCVRI